MPRMAHAGLPVDPARAAELYAQGLPVYNPTDPKLINMDPYDEYAELCLTDPKEQIHQ